MEYSIREIGKMFGLNSSTLRYYEEVGLLTNVFKNESGQRVYRECHVNRLKTVCCFKNAGMTVKDLQRFVEYEEGGVERLSEIVDLLCERREIMKDNINKMIVDYNHMLRKVNFYSDALRASEKGEILPEWEDYKTNEYLKDFKLEK